jgi:hypothetical protein
MHKRDGADLKAYFEKTRVLFTNAKRRWSESGNLDTSSTSFIEDLVKFMPRVGGSGGGCTSEERKRVLLLFVMLKVGHEDQDTELLNFSCREQPADIVTEEVAIPGGGCQVPSARKRRRMETESTERASEFAMFASTLKLGFECLSAAMCPVQDVSEV